MTGQLPAFVFLMSLVWLGVAIFVAYDAAKHNRSAGYWFVLTAIFGIFGLLWYSTKKTQTQHVQSTGSRSNESSQNVRERDISRSQTEKSFWNHSIEKLNHNNDALVNVSDGVSQAKFVIREDGATPQSAVYKRKLGDDWIDEAASYLNEEFDKDQTSN